MIVRLFVQTIVWLAVMGAVLFVSAGTLAWPFAWLYLVEVGVLGLWLGIWLARHDPALLAERMSMFMQPAQSRWDKLFMLCAGIGWFGWLVLIGIDGGRLHRSDMPLWLKVCGAIAVYVCIVATRSVFRANSYAAPVVKIQTDRGHKVSDSGPYAYVRHPMYTAASLYLAGTPLMLGSWWGLACVPLMIVGLGYRAVLEERTLIAGLEGYAEYATRVRYRLVPHVW